MFYLLMEFIMKKILYLVFFISTTFSIYPNQNKFLISSSGVLLSHITGKIIQYNEYKN